MALLQPQRGSMTHQILRTSDLKGSFLGIEGVELSQESATPLSCGTRTEPIQQVMGSEM